MSDGAPPIVPTTPEAQAMATVAAAVTGPDTPNAARVTTTPNSNLVWALLFAGPVMTVFMALTIWIIGPAPWPLAGLEIAGVRLSTGLPVWPEGAADIRIKVLGALGLGQCAVLLVIVWMLGAGKTRKISASAGPASFALESSDDA